MSRNQLIVISYILGAFSVVSAAVGEFLNPSPVNLAVTIFSGFALGWIAGNHFAGCIKNKDTERLRYFAEGIAAKGGLTCDMREFREIIDRCIANEKAGRAAK